MIKINKYRKSFEQEYSNFIRKRFNLARTNGLDSKSIIGKVTNKQLQPLYIKYFNSLNKNLEILLISSLDILKKINDDIWNENYELKQILDNNKEEYDNYVKICKEIFNYEDKLSKHKDFAYKISRECGVVVCPYCNINYTYTISDDYKNYIRPDFDHFLSKDKYPIFSLSLYNLIPCCHTCNHQKRNNVFSIDTNLYPFNEGIEKEKIFSHNFVSFNQYEVIIVNKNNKFANNRNVFHLDKIYKESFNDIICKKYELLVKYRKIYLDSLRNIDDILIIDYLKDILGKTDDVKNTSLGKLTNDIVDEIVDYFDI